MGISHFPSGLQILCRRRTENQKPFYCQKGFEYFTINKKILRQKLKHFTAYLGHQKDSKYFAFSMNLEFYSSEPSKFKYFYSFVRNARLLPACQGKIMLKLSKYVIWFYMYENHQCIINLSAANPGNPNTDGIKCFKLMHISTQENTFLEGFEN